MSPREIVAFYRPYFRECGLEDSLINHVSDLLIARYGNYIKAQPANNAQEQVEQINDSCRLSIESLLKNCTLSKGDLQRIWDIYRAIIDSHDMYEAAAPSSHRKNARVDIPAHFRHQVIIIDNAIYFLHSIGLPVKVDEEWMFTSTQSTRGHVDFVATRVTSSTLANHLRNSIWTEYQMTAGPLH